MSSKKQSTRCLLAKKSTRCKVVKEKTEADKEWEKKVKEAVRLHAEYLKTAPDIKARLPVTVSEITKRGFRVQTFGRDYRLTFKKYPWFADATEEELKDVVLQFEHYLYWKSLDVEFPLEVFDYPRRKHAMPVRYVRGEPRWDLFEEKDKRQKAKEVKQEVKKPRKTSK